MNRAVVASVRTGCRSASTQSQAADMAKWRSINKLASEGKWDNINNMPKMFLFGQAKKETYAAYNAINHKTDLWSQSPYGQIFKVIWRLCLLAAIVKAGVVTYEFVLPEENRLHYKYRAHGHH